MNSLSRRILSFARFVAQRLKFQQHYRNIQAKDFNTNNSINVLHNKFIDYTDIPKLVKLLLQLGHRFNVPIPRNKRDSNKIH